MDNKQVAQSLLKIAKELVSAVKWKERDDSKGHRWTAVDGDYGAHVVEIEGPGIPLYRIMVMFPSGDAYKFKRQVKKVDEAKKIATKTLNALTDGGSSVDMSKEWKTASESRKAEQSSANRSANVAWSKLGVVIQIIEDIKLGTNLERRQEREIDSVVSELERAKESIRRMARKL